MDKQIEVVLGNIRRYRIDKELTVEGLANDAGISRSHLYYIESGKTLPTLYTLLRLANALDIKMIDFFKP